MCSRSDSSEHGPVSSDLVRLASFLVYYSAIIYTFSYLIKNRIVRWPFHRVTTPVMAYENVLIYLPVAVAAVLSLAWLKSAKAPVLPQYRLKKFTIISYLVALFSLAYSMYMFASSRYEIQGIVFWPAVLMLSLLNAFSEETFYRVTLVTLLEKLVGRPVLVNIMQSFFYALPHYWIGGTELAFLAYIYGLALGFLRQREESVVPCIVCHFLIDIGNIGLPLLIIISSK